MFNLNSFEYADIQSYLQSLVGQMAPAGSDSRPARGNGRALQADFHDDHRERSRCESRHRSPRHGDGLVHELRAHRPCGRPRHVLLHLCFQPSRRGHREGSAAPSSATTSCGRTSSPSPRWTARVKAAPPPAAAAMKVLSAKPGIKGCRPLGCGRRLSLMF